MTNTQVNICIVYFRHIFICPYNVGIIYIYKVIGFFLLLSSPLLFTAVVAGLAAVLGVDAGIRAVAEVVRRPLRTARVPVLTALVLLALVLTAQAARLPAVNLGRMIGVKVGSPIRLIGGWIR
jgi:hypothetical protein